MLIIDPDDRIPPYDQLRQQLIRAIFTGGLAPGIKLPTVRPLAADLMHPAVFDVIGDEIGYSWTEVGAVLGVTRQAVQQRFDTPHKQYAPDAFTADLGEAMGQMKKVAVRYWNNHIGTEHLLWGLTAQTNNPTRLLRAAGASPQDLHQAVEDRMTVGASQAAVRIAWTPYARKAIALAEERARRAALNAIDCDHLLFGISEIGRGVAAAMLTDAGVGTRTLYDAAAQLAAHKA